MWEKAVITDAGMNLIAGLMAGETISVSSVRSGAGYTQENLQAQEEVLQIKQEGAVQEIKQQDGYIQISILFTNLGLKDSYGMRQIGIYVQHERKEILFALAQASVPKEIPAEAVMPLYSLAQDFRIQFRNDLHMAMPAPDPNGLCSMQNFLALVERVTKLEKGMEDCIAITDRE